MTGTTSTQLADGDDGFLNAGISATDSSVTIAPIYKYVNGVKTQQGFDTVQGPAFIVQGGVKERVYLSSRSLNATTLVTTYSADRGLSQTSTGVTYAAGTGSPFAKGARIYVDVDNANPNDAVYKSLDNTITGSVTINSTTKALSPPQMTTTQRDAVSGPRGIIENTTTNLIEGYVGGAWTSLTGGSVADATTSVKGKSKLAAAADTIAATAGAVAIPASLAVTSSSGAVNGSVPALNASSAIDRTIGGLGTVSGTAYTLLANGTTSTGATQSLASVGTSGQVLTSAGAGALPTFAAPKTYRQIVYMDHSTVVSGANTSGSETLGTHVYAVPSGDIVAVVAYRYTFHLKTDNSVTTTWNVQLGTTTILSGSGNFSSTPLYVDMIVQGTAAAGASVNVNAIQNSNANTAVTTTAVATNSGLTLQLNTTKGSAAIATMYAVLVEKISTTAF